MAYIPSIALEHIIDNSKVGLWLDTLYDGAVAFVCKIPGNTIRALFLGAQCTFQVSIMQVESHGVMCLGLKIQDEPENPFNVIVPNFSPDCLGSVRKNLECTSHKASLPKRAQPPRPERMVSAGKH